MRRAARLLLLGACLALLPPVSSAEPAGGASPCPREVEARARLDGTIVLTWIPAPGAASYRVLRAEGAGPLAERALLQAPAASFRDDATRPGATYRYVVQSADAPAGWLCAPVTVVTLSPASGIATALGISAVALAGYALVRAAA